MNFEDLEKKFKSMRGLEPDFSPILDIIIENNFDPVHAALLTETQLNFDLKPGFRNLNLCKLVSGCQFGEIALLHDRPRLASIHCLTACHFLVLSKHDYK